MDKIKLYESIMKSVANEVKKTLNEDSLDDFDIDGKIADKVKKLDPIFKRNSQHAMNVCAAIIEDYTQEFFDKNNLHISKYKRTSADKWTIYYGGEDQMGFTYSDNDGVTYSICVGEYGRILSCNDEKKCMNLMKALSNYIADKNALEITYVNVYKTPLSGILGSACYVLQITLPFKFIRENF